MLHPLKLASRRLSLEAEGCESRLSPSFPPPVILPLAATATQLTANDAVAVPPEGTVIDCGLGSLTVQFAATPESMTLWLPAASAEKVTLPFVAIV